MCEVQPTPYRHPGQAFLSQHGALQSEADVADYVEFLRQAAHLGNEPPIDLTKIYQHFGIPIPLRVPLEEQQGILVDSSTGIILIKEDDPIVRQRFTEGHELMELLFDAQPLSGESSPSNWSEQHKERLCDQGAADLLMPQASFLPRLTELGISFATGRSLAELYQTSLVATLVRMMQHGVGEYALVMWHHALKPTEKTATSIKNPEKKLRVLWRTQTAGWTGGFIPKNKSASPDSLITSAYLTGQSQIGIETIHLGWGTICCEVEAVPLQMGNNPCVLSLLRLNLN